MAVTLFDPAQPISPEKWPRIQYAWVEFDDQKAPDCWLDYEKQQLDWQSIPSHVRDTLISALGKSIRDYQVDNLIFSFDPDGEDCYLTVNFGHRWTVMLYNALDHYTLSPYCPENGEGITPVKADDCFSVPCSFALYDLEASAEIICHLLRYGRLWPGVRWAIAQDPLMPWDNL